MSQIKRMLAQQDLPKFENVWMTPELAAKYLGFNYDNRTQRKKAIGYISEEIKNGNWKLNGDTVRISKSGKLLDGQHRLEAIIASGTGVWVSLASNLDEDVKVTIDQGHKRTNGDNLTMAGYSGPVDTVAAAFKIIRRFWDSEEPGVYAERRHRETPGETKEFVDHHQDIMEVASMVVRDKNIKMFATPSIIVALWYMFSKIDSPRAEEFFNAFATGEGLDKESPILVLRNQLISQRAKKRQSTLRSILYYFCTAFGHFLRGETRKTPYIYSAGWKVALPNKDN